MKKLHSILAMFLFVGLISNCKKDDTPLDQPFDPTGKTLLSEGNFTSDAHSTSGTVKIYSDATQKYVVFEHFSTESGPDLRIYLSTDLNANNFIEISALSAVSGNFYFPFSKDVDENMKNKVLIWCQDFSVLFGHATLN